MSVVRHRTMCAPMSAGCDKMTAHEISRTADVLFQNQIKHVPNASFAKETFEENKTKTRSKDLW